MIGFKKPPIKLIFSVFFISFVVILLIYIDFENNNPLPVEEITFSEDLNEIPLSVENKRIHEVSKGESLSVILKKKVSHLTLHIKFLTSMKMIFYLA